MEAKSCSGVINLAHSMSRNIYLISSLNDAQTHILAILSAAENISQREMHQEVQYGAERSKTDRALNPPLTTISCIRLTSISIGCVPVAGFALRLRQRSGFLDQHDRNIVFNFVEKSAFITDQAVFLRGCMQRPLAAGTGENIEQLLFYSHFSSNPYVISHSGRTGPPRAKACHFFRFLSTVSCTAL